MNLNTASTMFCCSQSVFNFLIVLTILTNCFADILVINRLTNNTEKDFIDFELTSAAEVPNNGIMGVVDIANPEHGCLPMTPPPGPINGTLPWFALIKRNKCSLEEKVLNAEKAGYAAAIIYNVGVNSHFSEALKLPKNPDIKIPGVLIGEDDGKRIASDYIYSNNYMVIIIPETNFNLSTYLLPFAVVIGVCFLIMLLFMIIKCIKDRRRNMRNRLSSRHLKHLIVKKFKKGDRYEVCAICLDEYCDGEKLRILPCAHAYHTKCIDPWLTNNRRNCPICKRKVAIEGVTSDDSESEEGPSERTPLLRSTGSSTDGLVNEASSSRRQSSNSLSVAVVDQNNSYTQIASPSATDSSTEREENASAETVPKLSRISRFKIALLRRTARRQQPPSAVPDRNSDSSIEASSSASGSYGSINSLVPPSDSHSINFEETIEAEPNSYDSDGSSHSTSRLNLPKSGTSSRDPVV